MRRDLRHHASLALNAVLVAAIVGLALPRSDHASTPAARESAPTTMPAVDAVPPVAETPVAVTAPEPSHYSAIASPTERRRWIVEQLRALGVPNAVLARVAQTDFEVQWDSRFADCGSDMAKRAAVQLEMDRSKDAEMRAALGEAGFLQWDQDYMLWEAMSTEVEVTPTEATAIYGLKKKLQQRRFELEQARLDGSMDEAAINDAYDAAYAEYYEHLKGVLGEERYAVSQQLDDAFTADILRHQLAAANPTDAQFQELFQLEKKWNQARAELDRRFGQDPSAPEYQQQVHAWNAARDQEYRRVLGDEAFHHLQKQQDPAYARMKKFQTLWGLDEQKIDFVYDTMHTYEQDVEAYRAQTLALQAGGQSVDWDTVNQELERYAEQARQEIQRQLGPESFDRLQRNHVLRFMQIRRRPGS